MTEQVLVVGGGVVGCAIARALAPDYDVTVVEKDGIGQGASVRAAGLVTIATAYPGQERIVTHALDAFRAFDGQHGFTFHELPSLEFPSALGPLAERACEQRKNGVDADYVSPGEMADCYPELNVPDEGCIRFDRTGWVVPSEFITALQQSATERGVTFETGSEVSGFSIERERITAVDTDAGRRSPDEVILAAGWQTPSLLEGLVKLPVRPYWTQCVELGAALDLSDVPMGWVPTEDLYWRPTRSGTLLMGGGSSFADEAANAPTNETETFRQRMTNMFPA